MGRFSKLSLFPWLTLLLGAAGYGLQYWLFSSVDDTGLLPVRHPAHILSLLLLALFLGFCMLAVQPLSVIGRYTVLFPRSPVAVIGNLAAAVGFLFRAFNQHAVAGNLSVPLLSLGIAAALCVLYAGYCRWTGARCHYLARVVICVYWMLQLVLSCRNWNAQPQLQRYLFPFLAALFLLLSCYYRTILDSQKSSRRGYIFCTQAALLCCIFSIAGEEALFHLLMALWIVTDSCRLSQISGRFLKQ